MIIPIVDDIKTGIAVEGFQGKGLEIGSPIRVIRSPYFGKLGKVTALPSPLQKLESESMARVLEVEFDSDGKHAVIPRANVEMIED